MSHPATSFHVLRNLLRPTNAFAALKADGSITAWGDSSYGGSGAPTGKGFTSLQSVSYIEPFLLNVAVTATSGSITSNTATPNEEVVREGLSPVSERGFMMLRRRVMSFRRPLKVDVPFQSVRQGLWPFGGK